MKSRLERGRKKLGDALTKRGVVAGAGLLILAVTSPAEASPSRLVEAILTAVMGSAPAAVIELARGVAVNGIISKAVLALAALVAVVSLGIGLGSLRSNAAGPESDKPAHARNQRPTLRKNPLFQAVSLGRPANRSLARSWFCSARTMSP